ncbi:MAG TPA: SDR family oxidoreductase [Ferruginibacter sp.]|nr:SDR family oxidoreductase [Ferruginibacter sp.]HMP21359.1 SDR family oxidoreductase [Ferruginibacter sp.]
MKILITGSNGLLGQHLVHLLLQHTSYQVIATGKGPARFSFAASAALYQYVELDITDAVAVHRVIQQYTPNIIIHAAAMTQPDPCELHPVQCWNINVTATRFLISAATAAKAYFIYVSTDFVFSGEAGPYKEEDATGPVNYYGSSKLAAEKAVMESDLHWAVVRTVLVYGNILAGNRSNIITWVKENLENNRPIKVVNDQWRTPTYVKDLAKGILLLFQKKAAGIYHISGGELMRPYDMAVAVADYLQLDKTLMTEVNASTFTQPAMRPLKTGFIIDKAVSKLGYQPTSFTTALKDMLG